MVKEGERRNFNDEWDALLAIEKRKEKALSVYENVQQQNKVVVNDDKPENEKNSSEIQTTLTENAEIANNNTTWYEYGCV